MLPNIILFNTIIQIYNAIQGYVRSSSVCKLERNPISDGRSVRSLPPLSVEESQWNMMKGHALVMEHSYIAKNHLVQYNYSNIQHNSRVPT